MKIVESADGTIRVIELDPTKIHWLILDANSGVDPRHIRWADGQIFIKKPGTEITIVEGDRAPDGMVPFAR